MNKREKNHARKTDQRAKQCGEVQKKHQVRVMRTKTRQPIKNKKATGSQTSDRPVKLTIHIKKEVQGTKERKESDLDP